MKRPGGFSLVELLVVIAIIGVLVAIAMPALNRSRQAARSVACLSNLKQIGVLLNTYLPAGEGRLPKLNNRKLVTEPGPALDTLFTDNNVGPKLFACPADDRGIYEKSGTSYYWNITINGQSINNLFSIVGGTNPQAVPLLADKEGFHPDLHDRVNTLYADSHVSMELTFTTNLP